MPMVIGTLKDLEKDVFIQLIKTSHLKITNRKEQIYQYQSIKGTLTVVKVPIFKHTIF